MGLGAGRGGKRAKAWGRGRHEEGAGLPYHNNNPRPHARPGQMHGKRGGRERELNAPRKKRSVT